MAEIPEELPIDRILNKTLQLDELVQLCGDRPVLLRACLESLIPLAKTYTAEECCRIQGAKKKSAKWALIQVAHALLMGTYRK